MSINTLSASPTLLPQAGLLNPACRYVQSSRAQSDIPKRIAGPPSDGTQKLDIALPAVEIRPCDDVKRGTIKSNGMVAEAIRLAAQGRFQIRFRAPVNLLAVYEQGTRHEGETFVEGLPKSTLRDLGRKLTLVPAGHEFAAWQEPRTPTSLMYFYFDTSSLQVDSALDIADKPFLPRLFFEDATLLGTALKLKRLAECPALGNQLYFDALGVVLVHELVRSSHGAPRIESQVRGGLASWQQRVVVAYIEDHLSEQISLGTLAQLVRLSLYYFCRAFKQSFGIPPHRYHTARRIEQAKALLAKRTVSVTEIGLTVGFSETSSFTAAFRRATGLTPSRYHRGLD